MSVYLVVSLILLASAACTAGIAHADVDMTGRVEKVSSLKTTPGEIQPLATSVNGDYRCADEYSVIGNKPYYFAIGNCKAGWTLEAVAYASENTVTHEHSYGGYIGSSYSYCGWIDTRFPLEQFNGNKNSACTNGSHNATELEDSSFMEKYDANNSSHDGTYVVNPLPCPEYANYRPWSTNNVEKELIRTAPAYAAVVPGSRTPALKWRYTTKYSSTDGTGQYVMVRDARILGGGEGNWVFVPRSCLSSPLPANEGESVDPPPPTATTGGFNTVTTTSANLTGSVNPNGLETHYYIEWGREASKPYEAFAPTPYPGEDVGVGHEEVNRSVTATGLKPGTLYYYRIVAQSPTGTSEGGLGSFTTVTEPKPEPQACGGVAVARDESTTDETAGDQWLYYVGANAEVYVPSFSTANGGKWLWGQVPTKGQAAHCTSPTVVRDPSSGDQWIYFVGSEGKLWVPSYSPANGGTWFWGEVPTHGVTVAPGTSPTVVRDPSSGDQWIYFVGSEGKLWAPSYSPANGGTWFWGEVPTHGVTVAPGTSPTVVRDPSSGDQWIYFVGSEGKLWAPSYSPAGGWFWGEVPTHGVTVAPGASPTVVRDPSSGDQWIYFVGSEGKLWAPSYSPAGGWFWGEVPTHGVTVAPGASPTVVRDPSSGDQWIYFVGSEGKLWAPSYSPANGGTWFWGEVPTHGVTVAPGASPTVVRDPSSGAQWIYFAGSEGKLWNPSYGPANGGTWYWGEVPIQEAVGLP